MHPNAHQSAAFPVPVQRIVSGARYSGVPQNDIAAISSMFSLLSPKSVILAYPSASIRTFSGFKLTLYDLLSISYSLFM